ncbi:hypothetical protein WJR50_32905 [Catalinimonas sp. 4WD22]|uniref:hypothetical protein n=1 Tax=Catalinimonas locisalis TaxID=3133978 RepID=UPI003100D82A
MPKRKNKSRFEREFEAYLQAELQGRYIFISQFDEKRPHLYELDTYEHGKRDPIKIIYAQLPKVGTLEEYSSVCDKYGINIFHDVFFEEASPEEV